MSQFSVSISILSSSVFIQEYIPIFFPSTKDLVKNFGFVPNGTRVYYLDRSQPPLLTDMAMAIFDATGDKEWLCKVQLDCHSLQVPVVAVDTVFICVQVLPLLVKEYNFWMCEESGHIAARFQKMSGRFFGFHVVVHDVPCI